MHLAQLIGHSPRPPLTLLASPCSSWRLGTVLPLPLRSLLALQVEAGPRGFRPLTCQPMHFLLQGAPVLLPALLLHPLWRSQLLEQRQRRRWGQIRGHQQLRQQWPQQALTPQADALAACWRPEMVEGGALVRMLMPLPALLLGWAPGPLHSLQPLGTCCCYCQEEASGCREWLVAAGGLPLQWLAGLCSSSQ